MREHLKSLARMLRENGESARAVMVENAVTGPDAGVDAFLASNELWGGSGSIADCAGGADRSEGRRKIERFLIELGKEQIRSGQRKPTYRDVGDGLQQVGRSGNLDPHRVPSSVSSICIPMHEAGISQRATITPSMVTYRYSEDGIDSLARKAARRSLVFISLAIFFGLAVGWVNGLRDPMSAIVSVGIVGAILFWVWRRSVRNAKTVAKSAQIELDQDSLTARSSLGTAKLGRNEVTEIRYMKDGILVRGANLRHMVQLKPELEGFQELATRIQDWVPASVRRTRSSSSIGRWLTSVVVGNLVLLFIALSASTPAVAIPCCILEAVFLLGCAAFVWRSKTVAPRLKWMMLIAIIPAISLIGRAILLSQSH